ncbi:MAG: GGDEF domain-containing protein [Methylothermaceae bacterium]|nr:GGDEF domain-containing protein [Methylothermaceae bacterium]
MSQEQVKLAVIDNPAFEKQNAKIQPPQRMELLTVLQTTLVLDQLLQLFSREIQQWVPHDGFKYRHETIGLAVQGGGQAHHRCHYTLTMEEQNLGELTLQRRKRFSEAELRGLESLLCCLIYPLRNALLYYQALQSAYTDPLTGLYNRTALHSVFQREWKLAQRQKTPLSVLVLDSDYFKQINDNHGHAAGDAALIKIAHSLEQTVRASDIIFRYGGEEFVILLNNTPADGGYLLAERVRRAIQDIDCSDIAPDLRITMSIGVAALNHPEETPDQLLKRADDALYQAKRQGRDRVVLA